MAIDQTPSPTAPKSPLIPAIDNEFATYRAISSAGVLSLILGMASVFCYADLWFLVVAAASVAAGLVALRNIRRLPDVLTGAVFARIGIGIALLFGLTSLTRAVAQEILVNIDAGRFARLYVEVLKDPKKSVEEAYWYQQPPDYRKSKAPIEIAEEVRKSRKPQVPIDPFEERTAPIARIKERLSGQGQTIRFARIESKATQGLTLYAHALVELDGPESKDVPAEQFALLQLVKGPQAGPYDWVVEDIKFPYTPASTVATVKHADDGHGHGH